MSYTNIPSSLFVIIHCLHETVLADGHPENSLLSSVYSQIATRNLYNAGIAGLGYDVTVGARYLRIIIRAWMVIKHTHTFTQNFRTLTHNYGEKFH